ncbi:ATP-binding protein [Bacillus cereus group sp. BfR-BA-01310]|uniref:ATP-binding protein n=1 Tax=Bacillus cereus group sp. BfR-BA-01310 TaxID=2920287 RepID=UPI001F56DFBA|nr:DUF499 domain-containing protein [Bacillus cereus group sp. BfR-BA-01310]
MLGLQLRKEFRGRILKGTAIDFNNEVHNERAEEFLDITYPSNDLLKMLEAVSPNNSRPVVLIGERGQGKSHLLTTLYHFFAHPNEAGQWLEQWATRLKRPEISKIPLRGGMHVVAESLQRQNYKFLWDILLERHPHGQYIRGKWEGQGERRTEVLGYDLVLEMVKMQPTAIIFDEFQIWYDSLTNTKQYPWKNWAFNFIQILSEIAEDYPELLVLVVSVRNGHTDAYQQIHRRNPTLVDFKGQYVKRDRKRLLLHRLFENRMQISENDILQLIDIHLNEYFRLLHVPEAEQEAVTHDFVESWPFSPQLLQLLEDQVLVSTDAQETRDLIKILANLYKQQANSPCIITAASFSIEEDRGGVAALLDSISNEYHKELRERAHRNLKAVREAVKGQDQIPHASSIISALWLRSLAMNKFAGAERNLLLSDITQNKRIDDNTFFLEMNLIINNSFNIHEQGEKLVFKKEENPQAKLLAFARNDRLFQDASDIDRLAKEVAYVISGSGDVATKYRVIVLRKDWQTDPWKEISETEHPSKWDNRIPLIVVPEHVNPLEGVLGRWLGKHISAKRNTIRFLLPKNGAESIYRNKELLLFARAVLKADEWKQEDPEYRPLFKQYQNKLRDQLEGLFDRFAILDIWSFGTPEDCEFHIEAHQVKGTDIPDAIHEMIRKSLFEPEDFEELVLDKAKNNDSVDRLLTELQEPRPGGRECIPWLGETEVKEKLIRLCTKGLIAFDLRGMEKLYKHVGENEEEAWKRMRGKLGTGSHLKETYMMLPSAIPTSSKVEIKEEPSPDDGSSTQGGGYDGTYSATGTQIGGVQPDNPGTVTPNISNLFGGASTPPVTQHIAPATSSLNLMGKAEGWGINSGSNLKNVTFKVDKMTGAQLQKLLRSLPDGIAYELKLDKEE